MEKILSIIEGSFNTEEGFYEYDGYEVITDQQNIKFGISNSQDCCERFGYLITNDDASEFMGASLLGVSVTDTALNSKSLDEIGDLDCGDVMFVNLETDKGLLQFVAYNAHNGYYGHEAVIISKQCVAKKGL